MRNLAGPSGCEPFGAPRVVQQPRLLNSIPALVGKESIFTNPNPKKFTWFPVYSTMACAIILPAVLYIIRRVRLTCRNPGLAAPCLFFIPKVRSVNGFYGTG